jgi:hypothetical protein
VISLPTVKIPHHNPTYKKVNADLLFITYFSMAQDRFSVSRLSLNMLHAMYQKKNEKAKGIPEKEISMKSQIH